MTSGNWQMESGNWKNANCKVALSEWQLACYSTGFKSIEKMPQPHRNRNAVI